jgi:ketosteroid isomerase-like protein
MRHQDVVENIYEKLAEGDAQPIFDILDEDAPWIEAENIPYSPGHPWVGHDAVKQGVFARLQKDFSDFHINVNRIVAVETVVLAEGRYVGTTVSGESLDAIFAHVWTFENDRVIRFDQYSDTWQWRRVLGVDV